ncbi:MAG TPA: RDD family protein [Bacteroidetes bacterium]|nr:RDD family protein [Bacteroidota bacterium]
MATIDIRTTQNVTIEYELSSLRDRFFAFFLDLVSFYFFYFLLVISSVTFLGRFMTSWGGMFLFMMQMAGLMLYHFLFLLFMHGQTLGKRAVGLRVVRLDGQEPGPGEYLMRSLFLLLDFIFSAGVLGAILISSTLRHQRLGDLAANTTVIRTKSRLHFHLNDILNIQSIEVYEPRYPAVKQLSEQDVLLLKNILNRYLSRRNAAHVMAIKEAVQTVSRQLGIEPPVGNQIEFLKTLIRDYIVLTR